MRRASVLLVATSMLASCDPVVDSQIAALGGEAPGVRKGPLHRPGQPCLLCHDGTLGNPQRFTVAGTVFRTPGALVAAQSVEVDVTDANGQMITLTTNQAGNFYVTPGQYDPTFPLQVAVRSNAGTVHMQTLVAGNGTTEPNGACASCHFDPAGPASPGHVCLALDDGGTPP